MVVVVDSGGSGRVSSIVQPFTLITLVINILIITFKWKCSWNYNTLTSYYLLCTNC